MLLPVQQRLMLTARMLLLRHDDISRCNLCMLRLLLLLLQSMDDCGLCRAVAVQACTSCVGCTWRPMLWWGHVGCGWPV